MSPVVVTCVMYRTHSELPPQSIPGALARDERRLLDRVHVVVNVFLLGLGFVWIVSRMPSAGPGLDASDTVHLLARKIGEGLRAISVSHLAVAFPGDGVR